MSRCILALALALCATAALAAPPLGQPADPNAPPVTGMIFTETGLPLQGLPVLVLSDAPNGPPQMITFTDTDGSYRVEGLPPGAYTLRPITQTEGGAPFVIPEAASGAQPVTSITLPELEVNTRPYTE